MRRADFLFEIQTEELPPKALLRLAKSLLSEVTVRLQKLALPFHSGEFFATPRRLAIRINKLTEKQIDTLVERKGPALKAAFGAAGQPTPACIGFARSCGVTPAELIVISEKDREWVGFRETVAGKTVEELLPTVMREALAALPIPKRMRWGAQLEAFVRPVHSVILLYGRKVITTELFGCQSSQMTMGHRFHSHKAIPITMPAYYEKNLERHFVIADFARRRQMIQDSITEIAISVGGIARLDEALLDEVTGLVEWPVAVSGHFDKNFLLMPSEILISAMQDHQRYFPVVDKKGKLLPRFITVLNLVSRDVQHVIAGNERVLRARLSDAAFFFENDKKQTLASRCEKDGRLEHTVFHAKLGTLADRSRRVAMLAEYIANKLGADSTLAKRAGHLAFADLATEVVGEFPELQGTMGKYYALSDGEPSEIAQALAEQYLPRFAGDKLPQSIIGNVLALASRVDLLTGIFGVREMPTGDRDPFALRRAALGIVRILIEKKIQLNIKEIVNFAVTLYPEKMIATKTIEEVTNFIFERLKYWYVDQGIPTDVFAAVAAVGVLSPYDFHQRVQAVQEFIRLPEAASLSIANKRVNNILSKSENEIDQNKEINAKLFELAAEKNLAAALARKRDIVLNFSKNGNYARALSELSSLRMPVDDFFANVLVMAEDEDQRHNRLQLLVQLRALFLHVADIACLQ